MAERVCAVGSVVLQAHMTLPTYVAGLMGVIGSNGNMLWHARVGFDKVTSF